MGDIITIAVSSAVGTLAGGLITFLCSRHFYLKAAKGLEREAVELRRLTTLVLRGMEESGLAELNRDESGRITGLILKGGASLRRGRP